jgi:hypothetical protein
MSEAPTNPDGEVTQPQLNMFDVMFGSEENTNPEQAIEEPATEEIEVEANDEAEEEVFEEAEEYEVADEEAPAETPQAYTVKVDGEEFEVTLDELRDGYQRQSDYTRKSQSLAEQRKAYEANLQAVQNERNQYAQVLEQMSENQNYQLQQFEDINWKELRTMQLKGLRKLKLLPRSLSQVRPRLNHKRSKGLHRQNERDWRKQVIKETLQMFFWT